VIIKDHDDLRRAIEQMAADARVSVTGLNELAGIAKGVLTRFMRGTVRRRLGPEKKLSDQTIPTDLRTLSLIKVVEAAGYELIIQPKSQTSRRQQVRRAAARQRGDANVAS
jgi:hypothetical protein